jgi:hypothetical protein
MTIDRVSTGNPGRQKFLDACNEISSGRGALPMLNQTARLTRPQLEKALGDRWPKFSEVRAAFDPQDRPLHACSAELLGIASHAARV